MQKLSVNLAFFTVGSQKTTGDFGRRLWWPAIQREIFVQIGASKRVGTCFYCLPSAAKNNRRCQPPVAKPAIRRTFDGGGRRMDLAFTAERWFFCYFSPQNSNTRRLLRAGDELLRKNTTDLIAQVIKTGQKQINCWCARHPKGRHTRAERITNSRLIRTLHFSFTLENTGELYLRVLFCAGSPVVGPLTKSEWNE